MSRITDRLLVQRVDEQMVVMDDVTGAEITFPVDVVPNVIAAMVYLSSPDGEWLVEYTRKQQAQAWHYGVIRGQNMQHIIETEANAWPDEMAVNPYGEEPEPWRTEP